MLFPERWLANEPGHAGEADRSVGCGGACSDLLLGCWPCEERLAVLCLCKSTSRLCLNQQTIQITNQRASTRYMLGDALPPLTTAASGAPSTTAAPLAACDTQIATRDHPGTTGQTCANKRLHVLCDGM